MPAAKKVWVERVEVHTIPDAPQLIGAHPDIMVAMDWTDSDHNGQSTLVLSLVRGYGPGPPLIWHDLAFVITPRLRRVCSRAS